jgi:C4-type Zn-finger protein
MAILQAQLFINILIRIIVRSLKMAMIYWEEVLAMMVEATEAAAMMVVVEGVVTMVEIKVVEVVEVEAAVGAASSRLRRLKIPDGSCDHFVQTNVAPNF